MLPANIKCLYYHFLNLVGVMYDNDAWQYYQGIIQSTLDKQEVELEDPVGFDLVLILIVKDIFDNAN